MLAGLALLISACAGGGGGGAAPPAGTGTPFLRWGYNPLQPTGQADPEPVVMPLPAGYRIEAVVSGIDRPSAVAAVPDGRLLVAEQAGAVRVVQNGRLLEEPFISVDVYLTTDLGLVGLTVDPEFDRNGYVYLMYPADNPRRTVIARVRDEAGRGTELEEIASFPGGAFQHVGGGMRFAPDGTLFVGVGDHERLNEAQNPLSPYGSVLRINRDGTWPSDNPFIGPVYAFGLRNPFGLAIDPNTGRIFVGENGLFGQDAVIDVSPGAYYGWPGVAVQGTEDGGGLRIILAPDEVLEAVDDPLLFFHDPLGMGGMEFYAGDALPELRGNLYFCQVNGGALHEITFHPDGTVAGETVRGSGCSTGMTTGADGLLYFLDYLEGTLTRIAADAE